jgi:hypothetical protein
MILFKMHISKVVSQKNIFFTLYFYNFAVKKD